MLNHSGPRSMTSNSSLYSAHTSLTSPQGRQNQYLQQNQPHQQHARSDVHLHAQNGSGSHYLYNSPSSPHTMDTTSSSSRTRSVAPTITSALNADGSNTRHTDFLPEEDDVAPGPASSLPRTVSKKSRFQSKSQQATTLPGTLVPEGAPIPLSLREKISKRKAHKLPLVSSVVDAIIQRLRVSISTLHLHEPNATGFHVDLWLRLVGTGPIKAKILFPQGVTLTFRLPGHEDYCKTAAEAKYHKCSPKPTSKSAKGAPSAGKTGPAFTSVHSPDDLMSDTQSINGKQWNTGELGHGTPYTIKAHLEPVKITPIGDVPVRIRIEATGAELANITALVNKVVRTHGDVRLVLRAEGAVVKAYGLRVAAKLLEKDIVFEGLSHLTNVLRYSRSYPPPGLGIGSMAVSPSLSSNGSSQNGRTLSKHLDGQLAGLTSPKQRTGSADTTVAGKATVKDTSPSPYVSEVFDLNIISGSQERGIEFTAKINLPNPANITVDLAALELDLCITTQTIIEAFPPGRYGDNLPSLIPIGYIQLEPTRLLPGDNHIEAYGRLVVPTPPPGTHPNSNLATIVLAGKQFLTGLIENRPMQVAVTAPGTTSISPVLDPTRPLTAPPASRRICPFPWLSDALEGIIIDLVLPPLGERVRLLDGAEFRFEVPAGQSAMAGPPVPRPIARTWLRQGLGVPMNLYSLKVDCIIDLPAGVTGSKTPTALAAAAAAAATGASLAPSSSSVRRDSGRSGSVATTTSSVAAAAGPVPPSSDPHIESLRIAIVQTPPDASPIVLEGDGKQILQTLPVQLNPDLRVLIKIVRGHAVTRKVDLGPTLTKVLDTFETGIASQPDPEDKTDAGADPWNDLSTLVANILDGLRVRAFVEVDAAFGGFHIPGIFRFQLLDLPVVISQPTAASLIPHISQPIVADIMQRMTLHLDNFIVNELSVHGIHAQCDVRLLNFGPMQSEVHFREGLELMLSIDGKWTRCGTALIADKIMVDPYGARGVQSDVFVVPLAGHAGGDAFAKFVQALVQEQSFSVLLAANQFQVRTGGVNFLTPIHKTIALEGMNGFRGLTVDDIEILGEVPSPADAFRNPDQKDALRIKFKINIPNQSSINLALARITLYMMFEGVCVGDLEVDEVQLKGKHVTHADGLGTIYIGADDQHETRKLVVMEKIGKLFSLLVAGKPVDLEVRGRRSWAYAPGMGKPGTVGSAAATPAATANGHNGAGLDSVSATTSARMIRQSQRIPWLDSAVRTINLPVVIALPAPLMIVKQINIGDITASFSEGEQPNLALYDLSALYELPYSLSLEILGLSLDIELLYRGMVLGAAKTEESKATDSEQWRIPPRVITPEGVGASGLLGAVSKTKAKTTPAGVGGRIKMTLDTFRLTHDVDVDALAEAIAIVADEDDATHLQVRGTAHVRARTALGPVVAEIQLGDEHPVCVRGLKGLRSRPLQHDKLAVEAANKDHINLRFDLLLYNPSPTVSIHVLNTDVSFAAFYKNHYVGRAIIRKELMLNSGECRANDVEFHFQPAAEAIKQVAALPSNLMSGRTTELWIQGDRFSTTIPSLLRALQTIRVPFLLKPILNGTLIDSIATRLSVGMLTSQTCLVEFVVNNPLGVAIDVLDLSFRATHRGEPFATCTTSFRLPADKVAPGSRRTSLSVPPAPSAKEVGQQVSPPVETQMARRIDKMVGTLVAEKGLLYLDIELEAQVELASTPGSAFPVHITYSQAGLPLKIRGLPGLG